AGGVFEVQPRPQAVIECQVDGGQVGLGCGAPAAGPELVEGVVVGGRRQHAGLADAQGRDPRDVVAPGADPRRGLDGGAAVPSFDRGFQCAAVVVSVDEELGLSDGAGVAGEAAQQVVDGDAGVGVEGQAALLTVSVGGLGGPCLRG